MREQTFLSESLGVLSRASLVFGCLLLTSISLADEGNPSSPQLGRVLNQTELSALPSHVFANGEGLPEGTGTAESGFAIYSEKCAGCHGGGGEGASALELVGDPTLLATEYPDKGIAVYWPYAPTLFEYIRRSMPPGEPYSLNTDEVYSVIAGLLVMNGLIDETQPVDAEFLSAFEMPNRNGFRSLVPHKEP